MAASFRDELEFRWRQFVSFALLFVLAMALASEKLIERQLKLLLPPKACEMIFIRI